MFCSNCGKKIQEGTKFCPGCGKEINENVEETKAAGTEKTYQAESKATVEEVDKRDRSKWLKGAIVKGIIAFGALWLLSLGVNWIYENGKPIWASVMEFIGVILFLVGGFMSIYAEIYVPFYVRKREINTQELREQLTFESYAELLQKLNACKCNLIKNVAYDEMGCVYVKGKSSLHTFVLENGKVQIITRSTKNAARLEANTIISYLVKQNNPLAEINIMTLEKQNKRKGSAFLIGAICMLSSIPIFLCGNLVPSNEAYISFVTEAVRDEYGVTYEEAFDNYFEEGEWSYIDYEGQDYVEFNGVKKGNRYIVQFELFVDDGYFNLYTIEINGQPQNQLVLALIMTDIFTNTFSSASYEPVQEIVEAPMEIPMEEPVIRTEFIGTWWDEDSQRCHMEISEYGNGYNIDIYWPNSASETLHWHYFGEYDDIADEIKCTNGSLYYEVYYDNGESSISLEYTDGTAILWMDLDGTVYWIDEVENCGETCWFVKSSGTY